MAVHLVLSVSRDPALAETRRQIMRELGCIVETAPTPHEAVRAFLDGDFDLVLLCQTISPTEKRKLVARMKSEKPGTPIISIRINGDSYEPLVDGFLQSVDGPTKLLSCIAGALSGNPPQASAQH
jgi:DNA-binding response OmpR family regulator